MMNHMNEIIIGGSFIDAEKSVVTRTMEGQLFRAGRQKLERRDEETAQLQSRKGGHTR